MDQSSDGAPETVDIEGIRKCLDRTTVRFALLFGSHARGTAGDSSDVDIAVRFSEGMTDRERFRCRNRIDAELQTYADGFVDVADIESLPTQVAHAALRDGQILVGDEQSVAEYREQVHTEYERAQRNRERDRQEFIDRLARGDT